MGEYLWSAIYNPTQNVSKISIYPGSGSSTSGRISDRVKYILCLGVDKKYKRRSHLITCHHTHICTTFVPRMRIMCRLKTNPHTILNQLSHPSPSYPYIIDYTVLVSCSMFTICLFFRTQKTEIKNNNKCIEYSAVSNYDSMALTQAHVNQCERRTHRHKSHKGLQYVNFAEHFLMSKFSSIVWGDSLSLSLSLKPMCLWCVFISIPCAIYNNNNHNNTCVLCTT